VEEVRRLVTLLDAFLYEERSVEAGI